MLPLRLLIYGRRSVLAPKELCLHQCILAGPGSKRVPKHIVSIHCSLPFHALPGLLSTSPHLVSLQAVWWLCQRGGLRELRCQTEDCSGKWSCLPQGFLLLQWLWPPYEALRETQWGLVCKRVSIWIPVMLPCTDRLPILCLYSLQNKLTIWQRQKAITLSLHTYALVCYGLTILEERTLPALLMIPLLHCRPSSQSQTLMISQCLAFIFLMLPKFNAETAEVINYQDWFLTGVMSKCWQAISLTWGRQGNMMRYRYFF